MMLKIAAIDVGSNAIRLVVGEVNEAWKVTPTDNLRVPVRLGQDAFSSGLLGEPVMQQTLETFAQFKRVVEDTGVYRLKAVATSAMREASNGEVLVERIQNETGIKLEIIDSLEEARLIHLAVSRVLDLGNKRTLLVDIGGGSVEVTLAAGQEILFTDSFHIGAVRLLKMLERENISGAAANRRIYEYAQAAVAQIHAGVGKEKISYLVGTGGNLVELGRLRQRIFGAKSEQFITSEELKGIIRRLEKLSVDEIAQQFNLRPDRADVILPASIVLQAIADEVKAKEIAVPNVGLKDGVLISVAEELSHEPRPERRETLIESAMRMGRKYQFDEQHALLTAKLARELFEQSASLHRLGEEEELLLEVAALLHDIGHFINTIGHARHGYYLLQANQLTGLSERDQAMVAAIVLFHRGKSVAAEEDNFDELSSRDQRVVMELAALLSLADGMDVSRTGQVQEAELRKENNGWRLELPEKLELEKWAIGKRKALFQDVFGVKLETG